MADRFSLTEEHCNHIKKRREDIKKSAQAISKLIGKSPAWLGQLERGRTESINEKDLVNLLALLHQTSKEEIQYGGLLEKFKTLTFDETPISWIESSEFDDYKATTEISICQRINYLLDEINRKISCDANHREKYAFLKSLETLCRNLDYSLEQTILLNSLELYNMKNLLPEFKDNYSHKLLKDYEILHEFGIKNGDIEIYRFITESSDKIYPIIQKVLSEIDKAQSFLRVLTLENMRNQIDYNILANSIANTVDQYLFSNHIPLKIQAENMIKKSLDEQISENTAILTELKKDMFSHKISVEKGIDYVKYKLDDTLSLPNELYPFL